MFGGCPTQFNKEKAGVGIFLSSTAAKCWAAAEYEVHRYPSGRMMAVRLVVIIKDDDANQMCLLLVSAHAPVGCAKASIWQTPLDDFEHCIARKHQNDILLIGADTNSSIGNKGGSSTKVVGRHGKKTA